MSYFFLKYFVRRQYLSLLYKNILKYNTLHKLLRLIIMESKVRIRNHVIDFKLKISKRNAKQAKTFEAFILCVVNLYSIHSLSKLMNFFISRLAVVIFTAPESSRPNSCFKTSSAPF